MSASPVRATVDFAKPGKQYGHLYVPYSYNLGGWANLMLPVCVIARGSGPTALVMAGNHGDEYPGQIAIMRLLRELQPDQITGRLILIPTLTMPAAKAATRLSPLDGKNFNRCFPGNPAGTPSEVVAHYLSSVLFPMSDIVVDIHTGGRSVDFEPCAHMHLVPKGPQRDAMLAATEAWTTDFCFLYADIAGTGLLPVEAEKQGKVVVTTEMGGSENVTALVHAETQMGLRNVLTHLGVVNGKAVTRESLGLGPTRWVQALAWEDYRFAPESGVYENLVPLGEGVEAGQAVGAIHFLERPDREPVEIVANSAGVLIATRAPSVVAQGDCVAVVAHDVDPPYMRHPMKITQVVCQILRIPSIVAKTASSQDSVLVRVRTDDGLEGVGEADSSPEVVKAIVDAPFSHNIACGLRHLLIGENPLDYERLWQKMYRKTMYFGRKAVGITAMAAVDMALWDLKGKAFGQPIHRLLGGKQHDKVRGYASILFGRDGKETADIARKWVAAGYTAVKFGWEPMGTSEAVDIDLVRGAREGLGPKNTLLIDAGCVYDARTALRRAHAFAEYSPEWFEEPLREDDVDGYVWLRDRSPVPIAAGEGECGRESFRELIDKRALDVYQVDLSRCGFTDAAYIRARVEEIGARLCNHCYTSPLTVAASIHWLSTCRDAFVFEDCVEDSPLRHELTLEKVQSVNGWMEVPDRPGLGVTLDEKFVQKYLVAESK